MAGDISIQVVPTSLQRVASMLGNTRSYLDKFTRDMLYQEAALAARAFMKFTPPIPKGGGMGDTPKAKKQGEAAVAGDIASIMMDKAKSTLNTFAELEDDFQSFIEWKARPMRASRKYNNAITYKIHQDSNVERAYAKMKNLRGADGEKFRGYARKLQTQADIRNAHDAVRRHYKGRIRRNGGPNIELETRPFVAEQKLIDSYTKLRQREVGKLSSGWWTLIQMVPKIRIRGIDANSGRKVPAWIRRHKAPGLFLDNTGKGAISVNSSVTIVNGIGDIMGVAREANTKAKVIQYRKAAQAKRPWQRVLDQAILAANKGGNPS
jgi:hypothetical protein